MGTFLKVGVAAVPVPLPVSSVAGGPAASPSREPKPVPLFLHPSPTLAEDKVTSAQQPQATSQGSPSRVELCHQRRQTFTLSCRAAPSSLSIPEQKLGCIFA